MNCSLYEDIWNVRIHFDNNDLLERKLSCSDVTYLNMVALMKTQGFSIDDSLLFYMETQESRVWNWLIVMLNYS